MRPLILLFLAVTSLAYGATAQLELVQIVVPPGFDGPTSASPGPGAHVDAYVRRISGHERGTLFQVTTYDFGSKLDGIPKEELGNGAEHYLLQFLGGIERQRTNFHALKPTRVLLGKIPAARVEWTGVAQGEQMSGVMYCVIVGTVVVTLHTQGFKDSPAPDRADALQAIESVKFRSEG